MKIVISGAHSQGKSTLVGDLRMLPEFADYQVYGNITREIKARGIRINEHGSDWSQALVIAKHIEYALTPGNALLDRCILDGLVYTRVLYASGNVGKDLYNHAAHVYEHLIGCYDLIFYTRPVLPLTDDAVRSTDNLFFQQVVNQFDEIIRVGQRDNQFTKLVVIEGSREERIQQVLLYKHRQEILYDFPIV